MDANTYYLNQHLAQMDAADALQEWRDGQAAELMDEFLTGEDMFETAGECMTDVVNKIEYDNDEYLFQLIVAAAQSCDPKLAGLAKPYYDIIHEAAAKLADAKAADMVPEADNE